MTQERSPVVILLYESGGIRMGRILLLVLLLISLSLVSSGPSFSSSLLDPGISTVWNAGHTTPIYQHMFAQVSTQRTQCKVMPSSSHANVGSHFYPGAQVAPSFVMHNWTDTALIVFEECRYSDIGSSVVRFVRLRKRPPFLEEVSEHIWDGFDAVQSPTIAYTLDQETLVVAFWAILPNDTSWTLITVRSTNHGRDWNPYDRIAVETYPVDVSLFSPAPGKMLLYYQQVIGGRIVLAVPLSHSWKVNPWRLYFGDRRIETRSSISWILTNYSDPKARIILFVDAGKLTSTYSYFMWSKPFFKRMENAQALDLYNTGTCNSLPDYEHTPLPYVTDRMWCRDIDWTMRRNAGNLRVTADPMTGIIYGVGSREVQGEPRLVQSRTCDVDMVHCGSIALATLNLTEVTLVDECEPVIARRETDCTYVKTRYDRACLKWAAYMEADGFEPTCVDIEPALHPTVAMGIAVNNQSVVAVVYYLTTKSPTMANFAVQTKIAFFKHTVRLFDILLDTFDARNLAYSHGYFSGDAIPIQADGADFILVDAMETCLMKKGVCKHSVANSLSKNATKVVDDEPWRSTIVLSRVRISPPWHAGR